MRRLLTVISLVIAISAMSFYVQIFLGYTYSSTETTNGWTLGTGFYEWPFSTDLILAFETWSSTKLAFDWELYAPLLPIYGVNIGPVVSYIHSNIPGSWQDIPRVGILISVMTDDFHLRAAALYPIGKPFDVSRDLGLEFRYFLKPPKGMVFKDKLFFSFAYIWGSYRFGVGLLEPLP